MSLGRRVIAGCHIIGKSAMFWAPAHMYTSSLSRLPRPLLSPCFCTHISSCVMTMLTDWPHAKSLPLQWPITRPDRRRYLPTMGRWPIPLNLLHTCCPLNQQVSFPQSEDTLLIVIKRPCKLESLHHTACNAQSVTKRNNQGVLRLTAYWRQWSHL